VAGIDPVRFWLELVGDEQFVQVRDDFRFDASRLRNVITVAARHLSKLQPGYLGC
jgi:hypothetical protein